MSNPNKHAQRIMRDRARAAKIANRLHFTHAWLRLSNAQEAVRAVRRMSKLQELVPPDEVEGFEDALEVLGASLSAWMEQIKAQEAATK